jgi:hypothetical protein
MDYVYFIKDESTGLVKIGKASNVKRRLQSLRTGSPSCLTLLGVSSSLKEKEMHARFGDLRTRGEWFSLSGALRSVIDSCDVDLVSLERGTRRIKSHPIMVHKGALSINDVAQKAKCSYAYLRQVTAGFRRPSFDVAERVSLVIAPEGERDALVLSIMRFPYKEAI